MHFEKFLTSWLLSLDASADKHELKSLHLSNLLNMRQVKISWEFLKAAPLSGILNFMPFVSRSMNCVH